MQYNLLAVFFLASVAYSSPTRKFAGLFPVGNITNAANDTQWCNLEGWFGSSTAPNMCYKIIEAKTSWPLAIAECAAMSAQLASIHDATTLGAMTSHMTIGKTYWLGGSKNITFDPSKNWAWNDDSKWDYANWMTNPKQPDDLGGIEFCLMIWGPQTPGGWGNAWFGQWNDYPCDNQLGAICQKKVSSV